MNFYLKSLCRPRAGMAKILLVMRLIVVLLTATILQVSASSYGQSVTLKRDRASLVNVFTEIRKQTGYDFFYSDKMMANAKPISIDLKQASLEEALKQIFENQALQYELKDKTVIIQPKEPTFLERLADRWAAIDISGTVLDDKGIPLPGATVKVKDGKGAALTDAKGRFLIENVADDAIILISYTGYVSKEVPAKADMGAIVMTLSVNPLDQVQIIAYGTTTQRLSTGNVTTIKADVIEKQPVNNPLLALQGRVPGLFIEQATGVAGGAVKVKIQGRNSLRNGSDPLYVIDGVPYSSQLLPTANPGFDILQGGSPMSFLNPSDIESIDVLKDADATAIYGSRAANGAILITTKKGKQGSVGITTSLQSGIGKVGKELDVLNTHQYLVMRREALKNDNLEISSTDYDINGLWDTTRHTNWQKNLIGGTSRYHDLQSSVSGGSRTTQFTVGAGYHRETTVFPGDFNNTKGSVRFNISSGSENQKFKLQIGGAYLINNNQLPNEDLTNTAIQMAPNAPPLYNSDGTLNWASDAVGNSSFSNPLALLYVNYRNESNNIIANSTIGYQLIPGLEIKSAFGYTNLETDETTTYSSLVTPPEFKEYNTRQAYFGNAKINTWNIEPQVTYHKVFKNGVLDVLMGGTSQRTKRTSLQLGGYGQLSDSALEDLKSAPTVNVISTLDELYRYAALFGRINYKLKERYIFSLNARRDGSSRFGPKNQFHNFGSVAAAWIFYEENLIKQTFNFLSFGKLRASYGTTGNDQIGEYQFLSMYNPINTPNPYQGALGLSPRNIANPYIAWEETRKLNIGLDLGFIDNRIILNTNYSRNRSSNQIVNYALSSFAGFSSILVNLPALVQNSGWELSLSTINLKHNNFLWNTNLNLTVQKNKLLEFPGLAESSYSKTYFIGKPITGQQILRYYDVDPSTGTYRFLDKDGNLTSKPNDLTDKTFFIDMTPTYYGGFQNTFSYKNFGLDFLLQFVKQKAFGSSFGSYPGRFGGNQPTSVMSRWQNPGNQSDIQRFNSDFSLSTGAGRAAQSTANWIDASYIRLKNISITWEVPERFRNTLKLKSCTIYAQVQNLFTITDYNGLDPETKNLSGLPPLKVMTLGIKFGL